jgi:excisionase family DNA binding protein
MVKPLLPCRCAPPFRSGATLAYLNLAARRCVSIILENTELSTVQAAEVLNVSRLLLFKLLEDVSIPCRKVGRHRRVRMKDVMSNKAVIDTEREAVLDQQAADAQEHYMGYGSK